MMGAILNRKDLRRTVIQKLTESLFIAARRGKVLAVFLAVWTVLTTAHAQQTGWLSDSKPERTPIRLAQAGADAYDPFADYSEFEQATDEEADINFFRNGRFFIIGFMVGYRGLTGTYPRTLGGAMNYGLFLSYFFDLRFALQFGYATGEHQFELNTGDINSSASGKVTLSTASFHLKYYMNTQNVTRGLADLNPYLIGGYSQFYRTTLIAGAQVFGKDEAASFDIGAGIEIPWLRNKMFFGIQGIYHLVSFADEEQELIVNKIPTGEVPSGDSFSVHGIIGVNF